jgi:hypothetical protein
MSCNNVNQSGVYLVPNNQSTSYDAFGRFRVADALTLFDSQNRFGIDGQFNTALTGSGVTNYLSNESSVELNVTTASGDQVVRETKRVFPYQPGKSLLTFMTMVMNEAKTNLRQRLGYFGSEDGIFLQLNGTNEPQFIIRTSTSGSPSDANAVSQSNWNVDKFDGTGPTGRILDLTKDQILFFDMEWLGTGDVRCGFVVDGAPRVAHIFHNDNVNTEVYMKTAILPVRYEITNTGTTASSSTLKQICSTVISEEGYQAEKPRLFARQNTLITGIGTSFVPLVSIRLNASSLNAIVVPRDFSVIPVASQNYEVVLLLNGSLTGASWNTSTFNNVDYDVTATAVTGGTVFRQIYASASALSTSTGQGDLVYNFSNQLGRTLAGVSDIVTLAIRTISGATTGSAVGAISFTDLTDF